MNLGRFITMTSPVPFQDKREYAQAQLTQAVGDGRLDLGRFSDLVGTVWETDDIATIDRITREVAVVPNSSVEQTVQTAPATPPTDIPTRLVAIFGTHKRKGRFRLPGMAQALCIFGDVTLDLSEASLTAPETLVDVTCIFGTIKVIVPPGVMVESQVASVFGEEKVTISETTIPNGPRITLRGANIFGTVKAKNPGKSWFTKFYG